MLLTHLLSSLLLLLPTLVHACPPNLAARAADAASPFTLGTDPPADPATLGYTINHFSLTVNNLPAMVDFYVTTLGMRHIFTYAASDTYTVVYLGYAHGGKNGTGFQTGEELYAQKNNIEGLIEMVHHSNAKEPFEPSTKIANTFSHIGLIVPDVEAAQARFEAAGATVVKKVGEEVEYGTPGSAAFGFDGVHVGRKAALAALKGIDAIGFKSFCLVMDPDGNLLEVQPQV